MTIAVFGYGSLVAPASTAQTLARPVEPAAAATLAGWRRAWTLARDNHRCEKTFARDDDGSLPPFCLGLNLEPDPAAEPPNGALIAVSEAELERLDLREVRYRRVDVTASVALASGEPHGFDLVTTYLARPEHHRTEPPPGAVVIANYVRAVEAAFAELGEAELERYRQSTDPVPVAVEIVEATLVRDSIPLGNPRAW